MNLTPEQAAAIHTHDRNLIVVAGAGSGKTRVLVERYLALLDAHPDWPLNALVAVTFTEKAAGEMRDRVRQALEDRLHAADNAGDPTAVARWSALLASMDSARISTIHGLCASILRANAAEAGIDPEFEVLDESDGALLREDVIESVLAAMVQTGDPALALFSEYGAAIVQEVLAKPMLLREAAHAPEGDLAPADLFAHWVELWAAQVRVEVRAFLSQADRIGSHEPPDKDSLGERWQTALDERDRLHTLIRDERADAEHLLAALQAVAGMDFRGVRGSKKAYAAWGSEEAFNEAKQAINALRTAASEALDAIGEPLAGDEDGADARAAELVPLWAGVLRRVAAAYAEAKRAAALLDFDDLELLTRDLLERHASVRDRYRGTAFKHLLVDEFQDTNAAQWAIIKALADLHAPGSLFVVGDEKQSIYAFRGADVSVFGSVRDEITDARGQALTLSQSFRTHRPLIEGFNALFADLLVRDPASPVAAYQVEIGTPMGAFREQPPVPVESAPAVEITVIDGVVRDENGVPVPASRGWQRLSAEECRQWEAYELATRIHALVDEGRLVFDRATNRTRPLRYDDVAVLFRATTHLGIYEDVFKAAGLPYVTVGGRGYYDRQEVWDVLSLLSAVTNPADSLALAVALRSPLFGLSDEALLALRLSMDPAAVDERGRPLPLRLWDALDHPGDLLPTGEADRVRFARDVLYDLRGRAGRVTVAELLDEALARTGYLAVLSALPGGARLRGNVEKLVALARANGGVTLGAFNRALRDLSEREAREGEAALEVAGAVTLMTVHASKGLEYPVVALADASHERHGGGGAALVHDPGLPLLGCKVWTGHHPDDRANDSAWAKPFAYRLANRLHTLREEAESLRLLYVAATRAGDLLLLSGSAAETKTGGWQPKGWLGLVIEALDLRETLAAGLDAAFAGTLVGHVRLRVPAERPPDEALIVRDVGGSAWELATVQAGDPLPGEPAATLTTPVLLRPVPGRRADRVRHLAATHIADLGSAESASPEESRRFYRERFRRQVLHDAPSTVDPVTRPPQGVTARQIGDIVHEALRWWRFPGDAAADGAMSEAAYREMLAHYAWREGITDEVTCVQAASQAYDLLARFQQSAIFAEIDAAPECYRELPFVYTRDGRIVHGIIDTLYRSADGVWRVLDYKTSAVRGWRQGEAAFVQHAQRYALQLGIYATAAAAQLGVLPQTRIHYIRYTQTVDLPESAWRDLLDRSLFERIAAVVEGGADDA